VTLKEAILLGLALNLIAGGIIGFLTGPMGFVLSIGIGCALLVALYLFFPRDLVIYYAGHGLGPDQYADVTSILKGETRDGKLNVLINAELFPNDPYPGKKKHVFVKYSSGSRAIKEKIRYDGDRLILP
jgi:hypothetical protein